MGMTFAAMIYIILIFYWFYAAKKKKVRLLMCIYWYMMLILTLLTMGFDYNRMVFDVKKLTGFIDYPTFLPMIIAIPLFGRLCFGRSLLSSLSKTFNQQSKESFPWWQYLLSINGVSLIMSTISSVNNLTDMRYSDTTTVMFIVGILPTLIFSILLLPLPFIQQGKLKVNS
jgi:hypothetical protein